MKHVDDDDDDESGSYLHINRIRNYTENRVHVGIELSLILHT